MYESPDGRPTGSFVAVLTATLTLLTLLAAACGDRTPSAGSGDDSRVADGDHSEDGGDDAQASDLGGDSDQPDGLADVPDEQESDANDDTNDLGEDDTIDVSGGDIEDVGEDAPADLGDADTSTDLADAADADTCGAWQLEDLAASAFELVDPAPANPSRTIRVRATTAMRPGCHERALPGVDIRAGTMRVDIQLRAWRPVGGPCTAQPVADERWITLRLPAAGSWTVGDLSDDALDPVTVVVGEAPRECGDAHEGPCQMDCDCDYGEACLGFRDGGGDPTTGCAVPCEIDMDCGGSCTDTPGGIPQSCQDGSAHCGDETRCPPHYECRAGQCRATFALRGSTRVTCSCDADCGPGLSCVLPENPEDTRGCERRCGTHSQLWCGGGHTCGPASQDIAGVAKVDSVCGWVGE